MWPWSKKKPKNDPVLAVLAKMLKVSGPEEMMDVITISSFNKVNTPNARHYYQSLVDLYGQPAVTEAARLIRSGELGSKYPTKSFDQIIEHLAADFGVLYISVSQMPPYRIATRRFHFFPLA